MAKLVSEKKLVLVTGGAGFIGSHVAEKLLQRGDDVIIVDEVNDYYDINLKNANISLLQNKYDNNRLRFYKGDICNLEFITNIFKIEKPKWIIHLAARAGVRPSIQDPFIYIHSNVEATTILLELANEYGNESFVFASSSSVYGGSKASVFKETDVVDFPVSPYAATKKSCELMAYTFHHLYGLNIAGLRFFTVYGPRGRPDMAPFKFIDRVSRSLEIQQFGDGSSSRDYTYIDDIVDGVILSLDTPLGYQIYNLGNGNPVGLRDFITIVEKVTNKQAVISILPDQPGDVPRTAADISKAKRLLGYEPKVSFEDGISRLAHWYRDYYSKKDDSQSPQLLEQPLQQQNNENETKQLNEPTREVVQNDHEDDKVVTTSKSLHQISSIDEGVAVTSSSTIPSSLSGSNMNDPEQETTEDVPFKPMMKKSTSKLSFLLGSHGETGSF